MVCLAFLTDFGLEDVYVGVMKSVAASIAPHVPTLDLSHGLPPQDVRAASFALAVALPYLPDEAVVCAVVDPGVGTARRAVALSGTLNGRRLRAVAPDNGLLGGVLERLDGVGEIVSVEDPRYLLTGPGRTFHGRDVFAPAAAHLAAGVPIDALGPALAQGALRRPEAVSPRRVGEGWLAPVVLADHFGTLVSALPARIARAREWRVSVETAGHSVEVGPLRGTFADVAPGAWVAYLGSADTLEVAVRGGSAAAALDTPRERVGRELRLHLRPAG